MNERFAEPNFLKKCLSMYVKTWPINFLNMYVEFADNTANSEVYYSSSQKCVRFFIGLLFSVGFWENRSPDLRFCCDEKIGVLQ